ncbi:MAG TPA: hypothetical protein VG408_08850, partial [Actinomycetota bacterium]|nr:hypothetical protein [Actinomycetota bacterium]
GVWVLIWGALALAVWSVVAGPLSDLSWSKQSVADAITTWAGGSLLVVVLAFLVTRFLPKVVPSLVTPSFVDVVRYLDTSPRSYEVRHEIRKGMVDLLTRLHDGRYDRIVVVAHSLGAYIAYDGITTLWAQTNTRKIANNVEPPDGLEDVEDQASKLAEGLSDPAAYQQAQRALWTGLREQGNPWLITDFVSVGTPMYFADRLFTKNRADFDERVRRLDLPTCPPQREKSDQPPNNVHGKDVWFSYVSGTGEFRDRSLHHAAPFAVVRWTNMWFPTRLGFFGDWFGGSLSPLFGPGVRDIQILGNKLARLAPGFAHALYFDHADDTTASSVTTHLRTALDLASTSWVGPTANYPTVKLMDPVQRQLDKIDRRLDAIEELLEADASQT